MPREPLTAPADPRRRPWQMLASLGMIPLYTCIVAVLYIGPLFADDLPTVHQETKLSVMAEAAPPPEVPPPPAAPPTDVPPNPDAPNPDAAPTESPKDVKPEVPRPSAPPPGWKPEDVCMNCIPGGDPKTPRVFDTPPPPPKAPEPQAPIPVGGKIEEPKKLKHVNAIYPPIAQSARVQGTVIIQAIINKDGHVVEAKVLRSVPLLDSAALEAVQQWRYKPTLLNGQPVSVIMTVTVNFTLQ